ncbi:hypothetical protein CRG98_030865 [Punica granatum]|uniref:Uncharacterized protein n=1 Tax=Punica granatum TaxID=22663 RepID=A0A2I0IYD0_PUNGR|nr:hypothetical protein CRG98_030865 [Punica granatum]
MGESSATLNHAVYPVPLDPGDSTALDLRVVNRNVHLPGDARRTRVRRSRHLPFYDPKVKGRQVTRV